MHECFLVIKLESSTYKKRPYGLRKLKYLLSGISQKKLAIANTKAELKPCVLNRMGEAIAGQAANTLPGSEKCPVMASE